MQIYFSMTQSKFKVRQKFLHKIFHFCFSMRASKKDIVDISQLCKQLRYNILKSNLFDEVRIFLLNHHKTRLPKFRKLSNKICELRALFAKMILDDCPCRLLRGEAVNYFRNKAPS